MIYSTITLWILVNTAVGNVINTRTTAPRCTSRTETLDTLKVTPLLGDLIPLFNPINGGTYNELNYDTALFFDATKSLSRAVNPNTERNVGVFGVARTATGSLTGGDGVSLRPKMTLTTTGKAKSFDLKSLYLGCGINTENSLIGLPTGCIVSVSGFDSSGKQKSAELVPFTPDKSQGPATLQFKDFKEWQKMVNVTIAIQEASVGTATVVFFDTVEYCAHY